MFWSCSNLSKHSPSLSLHLFTIGFIYSKQFERFSLTSSRLCSWYWHCADTMSCLCRCMNTWWVRSLTKENCTGHTLVMWPRWFAKAFIFMSALSRTSVARLRALAAHRRSLTTADCLPLALILPVILIIGPDKYSLAHLSSWGTEPRREDNQPEWVSEIL